MAAGILPKPGSKYGPCATECAHIDCAATRTQAATPCAICGKAIEYETRYYQNSEGKLEHALCAELAVEQERVNKQWKRFVIEQRTIIE